MKVLFFGDIFGTKGLEAVKKYLPQIKEDHKPHLIFVNGENIHRGFGITLKEYKELMSLGVSAVTLGNHAFSKSDVVELLENNNVIRPANMGETVPGKGVITIQYNQEKVTLINLMGRIFMGDPLDNPFTKIDELLDEIDSDYVFVDFHGEATSEKIAFGHYVDGRVTGVVGTHTHVPTADAMTLPQGTMYITDIGMSGAKYGVLGAEKGPIIEKFVDGMRRRMKEAQDGPLQSHSVLMDTDTLTIQTINIYE